MVTWTYTKITSQRHLEIDCTITPGNHQQIHHIWSIPQDFKEALVNSLIKKIILDHLNKKNYHPVSDLSFESKLVEQVVAAQLVSYLDTYNLKQPKQSAYRTNHSTDSTLLKVKSDIICAMNKQEIVWRHVDFSFCFVYILESNFSITESLFLWNTSFCQSNWSGFIWCIWKMFSLARHLVLMVSEEKYSS